MIKSGVKTSEFWVTLIPTLVSLLVILGIVEPNGADTIAALVKDIVAGVIATFALIAYILSRAELKKEEVKAQHQSDLPQPVVSEPKPEIQLQEEEILVG